MQQHTPVVGKHILGILTSGMYQDPLMIYREYIQNAADQIDELDPDEREDNDRKTIRITIDPQKRRVVIRDHATGISAALVAERLLNVADSHKDPAKNKGFRGIGRLAGLSYCQKLFFETSAKGETMVSRLEMDCGKLRAILRDVSDHADAGKVISDISYLTQMPEKTESFNRYFQVEMVDVDDQVGEALLDVDQVKEFISQIAPVKFGKAKFSYGDTIRKKAEEFGYPLDEYTIQVNGDTVVKPYKDEIYDSSGKVVETLGEPRFRRIEFRGEPLAWCWFIPCISGKSIVESKNPERKIRLRKCNIQIGFENFLDEFFPEPRSNGYMIGEIHLVSDHILPNGDRNGLDVSREASAFIRQLREKEFKQLWQAAREASSLSAAKKQIQTYESDKMEFEKLQSNREVPVGAIQRKRKELDKAYEQAKKATRTLDKARTTPKSGNEFIESVVRAHSSDIPVVKPPSRISSFVAREAADAPETIVSLPKSHLQTAFIGVLSEKANLGIEQCMALWKALDEQLQLP